MAYGVTFNGYSLQSANVRSRIIQHTNTPDRLIQIEPRARADGMTVVNVKFQQREIEVEGQISNTNRQTLVALVDQLKTALAAVSGNLLIDYGDSQRLYFATVDKIEIPEDFFNINFVDYKVTFICADPFGYATASGIASFTNQTAMLKDVVLTVSGSVPADPIMYLTINTANTVQIFELSNENTGESIVVNKPGGNFSNGDQIVVNCKSKQVQINGSGVDYTGRFPSISPATTTLRLQFTATSVNYDLVYRYLPAYS